VLTEHDLKDLKLPQEGELLGKVTKMMGGDNVMVRCVDGEIRISRIRGKMKRRMWIRENDTVLIAPWDFKNERADILWRYIRAHADWLEKNGYIPKGF
jgi:translation initiation factor 1A